MKMEHALVAPHSGVVRLRVRSGDLVRRDHVVAVVEPDIEPDLEPDLETQPNQEKSAWTTN